jgi:hypothetical protein
MCFQCKAGSVKQVLRCVPQRVLSLPESCLCLFTLSYVYVCTITYTSNSIIGRRLKVETAHNKLQLVVAYCESYDFSQTPGPDLAFDTVEARTSTSLVISRENRQLFTTVLRIQLTASSVQTSLTSDSLPEGWVVSVPTSGRVSTDWLQAALFAPAAAPLQITTQINLAH